MGKGRAPAKEISFVSLVAYGPKVSDSALAMGVYSFWNQAGRFPTGEQSLALMSQESHTGAVTEPTDWAVDTEHKPLTSSRQAGQGREFNH